MTTSVAHGAVVVGLDGSDQSLCALDWAIEDAQLEGRGLHIVHAHRRRQGSDDDGVAIIAAATERAAAVAPGLRVSAAEVNGSGESALISASWTAALVCVGAHGAGGIVPAALLGSTALAVAASARCPVVVVPAVSQGRERTPRVVIGVDESSGSHDAIGFAYAQADLRRVHLTAVHAWHDSARLSLDRSSTSADRWRTQIGNEEAAMAEALSGWTEKYPDVVSNRVSTGKPPAAAILASAQDATLIVLGSHHPRPRPDLFGSPTVRRVLHESRCPVVVVPQGSE